MSDVERIREDLWAQAMRQIETSRTLVFHAPRHPSAFFEALVSTTS